MNLHCLKQKKRKKRKKEKEKPKKEKGKKKKLNEGYTDPADILIWCFSFLFFLRKQLEESN